MADVFISYAKTDRPLALKLAAMLEAEGWKVWWDTSLAIGDDFRNEIMTELGRARAVVVIWTDASIKSDWVRSEAGRAQADRKLIPVKLEHLTYKDLPPPFDVLHTENISENDKISAAVVAQLAKPAVEPSAWALLTKGFKYEVLTWVGIIGGALTLFTNLGAVLKLADWASVLVDHWKEWTHAFWVSTFGWLGIHLPPEWTPVLSFLLFGSLLTIGQAFQFNRMIRNKSIEERYESYKSLAIPFSSRSELWSSFSLLGLGDFWVFLALVFYVLLPLGFVVIYFVVGVIQGLSEKAGLYLQRYGLLALLPPILLALIPRHKLHAGLATCLILVFWIIITFNQISAVPDSIVSRTAYAMIIFLPLIVLSVAPAKAISRRLIFLALGLLLLIALNELSKFGFDLTPPKLQG